MYLTAWTKTHLPFFVQYRYSLAWLGFKPFTPNETQCPMNVLPVPGAGRDVFNNLLTHE